VKQAVFTICFLYTNMTALLQQHRPTYKLSVLSELLSSHPLIVSLN